MYYCRRAAIPRMGNTGGWVIQVHVANCIQEVHTELEPLESTLTDMPGSWKL
jgi:hypothetical protein